MLERHSWKSTVHVHVQLMGSPKLGALRSWISIIEVVSMVLRSSHLSQRQDSSG